MDLSKVAANPHQHSVSTTYKQVPPLLRGDSKVTEETCRYCQTETVLSLCEDTQHWEKRLLACRLGAERAQDSRVVKTDPYTREETRTRRQVQMSPLELDQIIIAPLVIPENESLAEVFLMDALGLSYRKTKPTRFWPNPEDPHPSTPHRTGRMREVTCG